MHDDGSPPPLVFVSRRLAVGRLCLGTFLTSSGRICLGGAACERACGGPGPRRRAQSSTTRRSSTASARRARVWKAVTRRCVRACVDLARVRRSRTTAESREQHDEEELDCLSEASEGPEGCVARRARPCLSSRADSCTGAHCIGARIQNSRFGLPLGLHFSSMLGDFS